MASLVKLMSKCDVAEEYCTIVLLHEGAEKSANDPFIGCHESGRNAERGPMCPC